MKTVAFICLLLGLTATFGQDTLRVPSTEVPSTEIEAVEDVPLNWQELRSTNVIAIAYDAAQQILFVHFTRNRFYRFLMVPPEVVAKLSKAPSPGGFVHQVLRDSFPYARVEKKDLPESLRGILPEKAGGQ